MQLTTHGEDVPLIHGGTTLSAQYAAADHGPGLTSFTLIDQRTGDHSEIKLQLDPWIADTYEVIESPECSALIVCGARHIIAVELPKLRFGAAVALEYEEAETLDRPWVTEIPGRHWLLIATERRIWCIDERIAIRWMWSVSRGPDLATISTAPIVMGQEVQVSVRIRGRDLVVALSMDDGSERQALHIE